MASSDSTSPATVSVHALSCGHFTLPEHQFIKPSSLSARRTVPSLAFLIQHTDQRTGKLTRILFDLGLRRDLKRYPLPLQKHLENRQPATTDPDVVKSLAKGGLAPDDIDYIIYSHVHWDHIGEPRDFASSTFVVGHGSLALLASSGAHLSGSHSFFEPDLLPAGRYIELSDPLSSSSASSASKNEPPDAAPTPGTLSFARPWRQRGILPHTLDLFADGSLLIVNAPGHLPGHINVLARTGPGRQQLVYLGGDASHDRRLLRGEKQMGEWTDAEGRVCCMHVDREQAAATMRRIRLLEVDYGVEVVCAHDDGWEREPANRARFFGAGADE